MMRYNNHNYKFFANISSTLNFKRYKRYDQTILSFAIVLTNSFGQNDFNPVQLLRKNSIIDNHRTLITGASRDSPMIYIDSKIRPW